MLINNLDKKKSVNFTYGYSDKRSIIDVNTKMNIPNNNSKAIMFVDAIMFYHYIC